ncbi:MAG TPA: hypothetical protein VHU62_15165 [Mycobacterium sp.]|nr:hypothetical protein [Mycobacterium sp.]
MPGSRVLKAPPTLLAPTGRYRTAALITPTLDAAALVYGCSGYGPCERSVVGLISRENVWLDSAAIVNQLS